METNNYNLNLEPKRLNFPLGLIGAILGAALGGVVWYAIGRMGYVASLAGILTAFLSIEAFRRLAKGIDQKAVIICVVLSFIAIIAAHWLLHITAIRDELEKFSITFANQVTFKELNDALIKTVKEDSQARMEFLKSLAMGLVFAAIGCFSYAFKINKDIKAERARKNQTDTVINPVNLPESNDIQDKRL